MQTLASFKPRLLGSLVRGDGPLDRIQLLVFADSPEPVIWHLNDRHIPCQAGDTLLHYSGGRRLARPALRGLFKYALNGAGCETIFHDVYFGPAFPGRVHTAYDELAPLPVDIRERIILMHYNDDASDEAKSRALDAGFRIATREGTYGL
mgnify:CR=1 FL=1